MLLAAGGPSHFSSWPAAGRLSHFSSWPAAGSPSHFTSWPTAGVEVLVISRLGPQLEAL